MITDEKLFEISPNLSESEFAKKIHNDATALWGEIFAYFFSKQQKISEALFVPMIIFSRLVSQRDAIILLTNAKFPNETGIIGLSQFESKLDLAYASVDVAWATRWMEHKSVRKSVTVNVTNAIREIFLEEREISIEQSIFRNLSALKHGNPLGSELAFPIRRSNDSFSVSSGQIDDELTRRACAWIGGYATCQLAWSAQIINTHLSRYADCREETKSAVLNNWLKCAPYEENFASFLISNVETRNGHLDLSRN